LFYQRIAKINNAVTPVLNFTSPLFIGASFHLANPDDISVIEALDSVSAIWPVTVYSRPVPIVESIMDLYEFVEDAQDETSKDQFPPHMMTGVDKLHAEGYTGTGVSIAVIDSGVDYRYDYCLFAYISIPSIHCIDIQH
jgi:subtilisin family serine protease